MDGETVAAGSSSLSYSGALTRTWSGKPKVLGEPLKRLQLMLIVGQTYTADFKFK